jgi:hypothetical protein
MKDLLEAFTSILGTVGVIALGVFAAIGEIYWLWVAIKLGSFTMFAIGFLGPAVLITIPLGCYMLVFGIPGWVVAMFG